MTKLSVKPTPSILPAISFEPIRFQITRWFPQNNRLQRVKAAFHLFSSAYPLWETRYFDLEFIEEHVLPLFDLYQRYDQTPSAMDVALLWDELYGVGPFDERKERIAKLAVESRLLLMEIA